MKIDWVRWVLLVPIPAAFITLIVYVMTEQVACR